MHMPALDGIEALTRIRQSDLMIARRKGLLTH